MEKVEGLLQNLKLSDKEKKRIKIGWAGSSKAGVVEPQALAKLLSEKSVFAEALAETLAGSGARLGVWSARRLERTSICLPLDRSRGNGWRSKEDLGNLEMIYSSLRIS